MHFFSPQSICAGNAFCWKKRIWNSLSGKPTEQRKNVFFGLRSARRLLGEAALLLLGCIIGQDQRRRRDINERSEKSWKRRRKNSIWKWHCDQSELLEILSCLANIVCGWQSCHASLWPSASLRIFFRLHKTYKKKINHAPQGAHKRHCKAHPWPTPPTPPPKRYCIPLDILCSS